MIFFQELYLSWVVKDHRSIIHILEDLPSLKPPLDHLLELLPRLQARYYSISSSPKVRWIKFLILIYKYLFKANEQINFKNIKIYEKSSLLYSFVL